MFIFDKVKANTSGIYLITNVNTGKVYVGSSKDIQGRFINHRSDFKRGTNSKDMQLDYDNGEVLKACVFQITDNLKEMEEYWIDVLPNVYNRSVKHALAGWNKGLSLTDSHRNNLKKKKTLSEDWHKNRLKMNEKLAKNVRVYDCQGNFIKEFESSGAIERFSIENDGFFPIISRFKKSRRGTPNHHLKKINISQNCRGLTKFYKGLQFRYVDSDLPILSVSTQDVLASYGRSKK